MVFSDNQAAGFQLSQRLDKHLARDPRQAAFQHAAARLTAVPGLQAVQHHTCPFGGKQLQHAARRAIFKPLFFVATRLHGGWLPFGADLVQGCPAVMVGHRFWKERNTTWAIMH
jgi:hypothetical protein